MTSHLGSTGAGSDPIPFDWRYLEKPLLNLHRAPAEEIVEDEGDNSPGPTMHQKVSASPRARLALCCSALTGRLDDAIRRVNCGTPAACEPKLIHHLTAQPRDAPQDARESTDDQRLPTASTRRRTRRGPAHRGASDGGDANVQAHRSRAAAPPNTPVPAEAAGRCPKRQARNPSSEPASGDHSRVPPDASKRPKVAAQHKPAAAPAGQQQAPHGGMQLTGQLNLAALDAATVVMHMYRTFNGI